MIPTSLTFSSQIGFLWESPDSPTVMLKCTVVLDCRHPIGLQKGFFFLKKNGSSKIFWCVPNIFRSLRPGLSSLSPGPPAGSAARSPCSRCPFHPTLLLAAPRFLDVTPVRFCHVSVSASCVSCPAAPSLGHQGQSAPSTAGHCPTETSHGHFPSWPWNPRTAYTYACHMAPECGRTLLANFLAFSFFPFFFFS